MTNLDILQPQEPSDLIYPNNDSEFYQEAILHLPSGTPVNERITLAGVSDLIQQIQTTIDSIINTDPTDITRDTISKITTQIKDIKVQIATIKKIQETVRKNTSSDLDISSTEALKGNLDTLEKKLLLLDAFQEMATKYFGKSELNKWDKTMDKEWITFFLNQLEKIKIKTGKKSKKRTELFKEYWQVAHESYRMFQHAYHSQLLGERTMMKERETKNLNKIEFKKRIKGKNAAIIQRMIHELDNAIKIVEETTLKLKNVKDLPPRFKDNLTSKRLETIRDWLQSEFDTKEYNFDQEIDSETNQYLHELRTQKNKVITSLLGNRDFGQMIPKGGIHQCHTHMAEAIKTFNEIYPCITKQKITVKHTTEQKKWFGKNIITTKEEEKSLSNNTIDILAVWLEELKDQIQFYNNAMNEYDTKKVAKNPEINFHTYGYKDTPTLKNRLVKLGISDEAQKFLLKDFSFD
jgi:hypothetical protein